MSAAAEVRPPLSRFATELHDYLTAGFPALCVNTYEEERLLNDLRTLPPEWKLAVWSYTRGWQVNSAQGLVELHTLDKAKDACRQNPPGAVASIGQFDANTVCVFFDLHTWFPMHLDLTRVIRDTLDVAKGTNRPMLFCSPDFTLPAELLKDVTVLAYDLPTVEQLRTVFAELQRASTARRRKARTRGVVLPEPAPISDEAMADILDAARGLTWNEAENAMALALTRHEHQPALMAQTIWREKTQAVLKQGLLTLAQPTFTLEAVGGVNRFKLWTRGLGHLIHHAEAALAWGLKPQDLPKGCLLIGIPGTGKSMLAEAIAGQWGVPLVRLSVEDFLDSLVGNSERRFAAALRTAEALGRCVMHVDEAEKLFDTRNVSNDVMKHILGMLLTWLQERMRHASGVPPMVFVVMTVNKVNGLPPELYRPGRLDRTWFFDVGGAEEREAVLRLHLEARKQTLGDGVIDPLTAETKGWTPAELERMVVTACTSAFTAERALTADDIFLAKSDIKPFSETHKEQLEEIRGFAAQWATPANDGDTEDHRTRQPSGRSFA